MSNLRHEEVEMSGNDLTIMTDVLRIVADMIMDGKLQKEMRNVSPNKLDEIAMKFDKQRVRNRPVLAFAGLPGSGKTTIAEQAGKLLGVPVISMGDALRNAAPENIASDSTALGEFAARTRDNVPRQIPLWAIDAICETGQAPFYIIDGVRSPTDYKVLDGFFHDFDLVYIESDFYKRLGRIADSEDPRRVEEGESRFDAYDLVKRDQRELNELGVQDLLDYSDSEYLPEGIDGPTGLHDIVFVNNGDDIEQLVEQTVELLESTFGVEVDVDRDPNPPKAMLSGTPQKN